MSTRSVLVTNYLSEGKICQHEYEQYKYVNMNIVVNMNMNSTIVMNMNSTISESCVLVVN